MIPRTRPVSWIRGALKDFEGFPEGARLICLAALTIVAEGGKPDIAKPLHGMGSGVFEIAAAVSRRCVPRGLRSATWPGYLGGSCISEEIQAGDQGAQA